MNKISKFIDANHSTSPGQSSSLYPGSMCMKPVFKKPCLRRGVHVSSYNQSPPPTPPSSPKSISYITPNDQFIDEQHSVLDMAKQGGWMMIWEMLDNMPHLVNALPHPRRFNLLHHAIHQENIKALEKLLIRGAGSIYQYLRWTIVSRSIQKSIHHYSWSDRSSSR